MILATSDAFWRVDGVSGPAAKVRLPGVEVRAIRRVRATEDGRSLSTGSDAGHPPIACGSYRSTGRIFQEARENRIDVPLPSELLGVGA